MYVLSTGCQWRYLPKDLTPKSTVYRYFDLWNYDGTPEAIHYTLYVKCREAEEREASPTVAIIDSQSVKSAEKGGARIDPHGVGIGVAVQRRLAENVASLQPSAMIWGTVAHADVPMRRTAEPFN
jgi:putative transposase